MAEDKSKSESEKAGKKKGLKPLILVALASALGGAGIVVMAPEQAVVNADPEPSVPQKVDVEVEEPVEHNFNPRKARGRASAQIKFKFHYVTLDVDKEEAEDQVKHNWDRMISQTLILLTAQTSEQIKDPKNDQYLKQKLRETMTMALFPSADGEKTGIAVVSEILWVKK